jgi:hypothetical protein
MCSGWKPVFPLRYGHRELNSVVSGKWAVSSSRKLIFLLTTIHFPLSTIIAPSKLHSEVLGQALDLLVSVGSRLYNPYTSDLSTG